jgi:uncharacterized protein (DUF169 family)
MASVNEELSVLSGFHFERQPIGVKFSYEKPEGLAQLDRNIALCEMVKEAQLSESAFYATPENQSCKPAARIWGTDPAGVFDSGHFGVAMKIFKEPRANVRLNQRIPTLDKEIVRYISFAPLDKLCFTPDLLIILADKASQSEILLRAMTYTTGEVWSSKTTVVAGCAWLLAYPFLTGKVNYITTGFGSGMKAKKLFPEGRQLISIPYNWIPVITENLREMAWVLPAWEAEDLGAFIKGIHAELAHLSEP